MGLIVTGWRTNARHLDYGLLGFIFDYIKS